MDKKTTAAKSSSEKKSDNKKSSNFISYIIEIGEFIWDIGKTLIIVIIIAFVIRFYLVQPFYVEGQSMEPNFENGEYLLIDEISYHFRKPERGDVIVFKPSISTYQNYIKRIIALPYEKISFENNEVRIINDDYPQGKILEEKYLSPNTLTVGEEEPTLKYNEFFVLGDSRSQSSDSRVFGPLSEKNITGRVWFYIKIKPWKEISIWRIKIRIPKITMIGRVPKPQYNID